MASLPNLHALLEKTVADSRQWQLRDFLSDASPVTVSFLNAHGVNTAARNPAFYDMLMHSRYLLRDGIGIKLATTFFKMPETDNLNGTDLIPKIISQYKDRNIAIFGASDDALAACVSRLQREGFTGDFTTLHGFLDDNAYIDACNTDTPDILVLCMGMPRQELLSVALRDSGYTGLILCGGGWADFYSGTKQRAPEWVRQYNLEWIYRLLNEPKRLGKRYTVDILYFFYYLYKSRNSDT